MVIINGIGYRPGPLRFKVEAYAVIAVVITGLCGIEDKRVGEELGKVDVLGSAMDDCQLTGK